jgi:hypothetical protein
MHTAVSLPLLLVPPDIAATPIDPTTDIARNIYDIVL